jgi:3D (Asp-Asp-Asp) domain-containing protein
MKVLQTIILIAVLSLNVNSTVLTFRTSFYCQGAKVKGCHGKGITASGEKVRHGVIAADKKFKFGTKIRIIEPKELAGVYTVLDRGGKRIKHNFIDLWVNNAKRAKSLGIKTVKLEIIK